MTARRKEIERYKGTMEVGIRQNAWAIRNMKWGPKVPKRCSDESNKIEVNKDNVHSRTQSPQESGELRRGGHLVTLLTYNSLKGQIGRGYGSTSFDQRALDSQLELLASLKISAKHGSHEAWELYPYLLTNNAPADQAVIHLLLLPANQNDKDFNIPVFAYLRQNSLTRLSLSWIHGFDSVVIHVSKAKLLTVIIVYHWVFGESRHAEWNARDCKAYYVFERQVVPSEIWTMTTRGVALSPEDMKTARWVVTSPNMSSIPECKLGSRQVHMYTDGHFGINDRSRHPQFYCAGFEFYATIPTRSEDLARLWWTPTRQDTLPVAGNSTSIDLVKLKPDVLLDMKRINLDCRCEVADTCTGSKYNTLPLLLLTHAHQCHERLAWGMTLKDTIATVADWQRACLDLHGWLNYVNRFQPRSLALKTQTHPVDRHVMGAFTHHVEVAQQLFQMGIPVYLITCSIHIPARINVAPNARQETMVANPDIQALQRIGCNIPDLTDGSPVGAVRLAAFQAAKASSPPSLSTHPYTNTNQPVAAGNVQHRRLDISSLTWIPTDANTSTVYDLAKNAVQDVASAGPLPQPELCTPPTIPIWNEALSQVKIPKGKPKSDIFCGLAIPPPHIFIPNSSSNFRFYMGAWLAIRVTYIHDITKMALKKLSTPSKQQWQNFFILLKHSFPLPTMDSDDEEEHATLVAPTFDHCPPAPSRSKRTLNTTPASSKRARSANASSTPHGLPSSSVTRSSSHASTSQPKRNRKHNPHPYLDTLDLRHGVVESLVWADKQILLSNQQSLVQGLSPDVSCEVLWELHMMGFNLELLAADQFMAPQRWPKEPGSENAQKRLEREQVLRRIFPKKGDSIGEFFISEIPTRDGGLTAHGWEERAPHILAFRELLLDWPGCPTSVASSANIRSEGSLINLERSAIMFYCASFASTFSRLPIPPVRLPFVSRMRAAPVSLVGTIAGLS
ncbi:hypothetical protein BKA70DRAFT_1242222 [Coprinopsis sp. MPI-PUGE-AT-0042]|nr:hypothetical protein BKA70DRAFT_1242222 [Coprinopsis sp. MPI-PUGE-AT-0042]